MKNDFTIADGVATVELTQGKSMWATVEALPFLAPYRWYALHHGRTWYAVTNVRLPDGRRTALKAHRLLYGLESEDPRQIDHIDGNGLNNLPSNLRITDAVGNANNRHGKRRWLDGAPPTSRFPGVYWNKSKSKWRVQIKLAGRHIHLGYFDIEADAAEMYLRAKAIRDAGGSREEIRATRSSQHR